MNDISQDAKQWGNNLNNASWAAINAWDSEIMGPMSGAVFNNIKGVVRAAILKYLEGYDNTDDQSSLKLSLVYALNHSHNIPVYQFRKQGCSDWYDGKADPLDGNGPYEERVLFIQNQQLNPLPILKQIRLELERINAHIDAAEAACEADLYKAKGV